MYDKLIDLIENRPTIKTLISNQLSMISNFIAVYKLRFIWK